MVGGRIGTDTLCNIVINANGNLQLISFKA